MGKLIAEYAIDSLPYFDHTAKEILKKDARDLHTENTSTGADKHLTYASDTFIGPGGKRVHDAKFRLVLDCMVADGQAYMDEFMRATWGEMIDNAFRYSFYVGGERDARQGYMPGKVYASLIQHNANLVAVILDDGPGFSKSVKMKYHRRTNKIRDSSRVPGVRLDDETRNAYIDGDVGGLGLVLARRYCENLGGRMLIGDAEIVARELGLKMRGARVEMSWPIESLERLDDIFMEDRLSENPGV